MKQIITYFILLFFSCSCWAQIIGSGYDPNEPCRITQKEIIGKSNLKCIYYYVVSDPIYKDIRDCYQILQIGNANSRYGSYGTFRLDSALERRNNSPLTSGEFLNIYNKYKANSRIIDSNIIIKDKKSNQLTIYDKVFIDNYVYSEQAPSFKWNLTDEESIICGYKCKKATCRFRGRQWIAWYSEEIQINDGPWKFSGLPGLILQVEDTKEEHIFTAIAIQQQCSNIYVEKRNHIKTSREKFNAELKKFKENARQYIAGSHAAPRNADDSPARIPKRRLFFNPIELE